MEHRLLRRPLPVLATIVLTVMLAWTATAVPAQAHANPLSALTNGSPWHPDPVVPAPVTTKTVAGQVAMMRADGTAAIPRGAPAPVRTLVRQANRIVGKPYKWGGGHAKLHDRGYDCSGAVSFALIKASMLRSTMVSGSFKRWGLKGIGRYVTVYARSSHVYMEVAGLRFDTSRVGDYYDGRKGVRWRNVIGKRDGFATRHPAQL